MSLHLIGIQAAVRSHVNCPRKGSKGNYLPQPVGSVARRSNDAVEFAADDIKKD